MALGCATMPKGDTGERENPRRQPADLVVTTNRRLREPKGGNLNLSRFELVTTAQTTINL
ncbi:hypothetical protein Bca52824_074491 [Brassica carinata]|uniref:Uncharacterized protein n=1 Tax=Brassica carinata TaxID=52824 RepID=A0A8X7TUT6_BRACI|nr:hypothetical protein Bca52824_074491 [Brassica carinata]